MILTLAGTEQLAFEQSSCRLEPHMVIIVKLYKRKDVCSYSYLFDYTCFAIKSKYVVCYDAEPNGSIHLFESVVSVLNFDVVFCACFSYICVA